MPSPMRNNKQLRRLGAALVALVLIFAAMTATSTERSDVTLAEKAISTLLYPLQLATDWVAGRVRGVSESVSELTRLRDENSSLREESRQSAQLKAQNELLLQENRRLQVELQMKERAKYPLLTAEVVARSPDNWYRTVVINRGSRDGVQQNMPVVNWQGLVGKVTQVTPFTATVQLVVDAGFGQTPFGAGAVLPSGEYGVIETVQGGHVRMKFHSSDPAVQAGQPVFTSGQGVMPPDLLIGYVESIQGSTAAFGKFATVRPAVDFHKLNLVHVVLKVLDKGASTP